MLDRLFGTAPKYRKTLAAIGLLLMFGAAIWAARNQIPPGHRLFKHDIYYSFVEGQRILDGSNPYSRIHTGDMSNNNKYATYFPGFYLLSAATQAFGARDIADWLAFWRVIFALFYLAIGGFVFVEGRRAFGAGFAFFCAALWLFNRWTVNILYTANIDFPPIFFLLLSLAIFKRHQTASFLLFGVSLALKQIAIFALPLYLIWVWKWSAANRPWPAVLRAVALIAAVPFVCSVYFLAWDATGFIKSVLFSATRLPSSHVRTATIDQALGWTGAAGRIPMLFTLGLVYLAAMKSDMGRYTAALFALLVFSVMNPVLYNQYFCWVMALIPLAACDRAGRRAGHKTKQIEMQLGEPNPPSQPKSWQLAMAKNSAESGGHRGFAGALRHHSRPASGTAPRAARSR